MFKATLPTATVWPAIYWRKDFNARLEITRTFQPLNQFLDPVNLVLDTQGQFDFWEWTNSPSAIQNTAEGTITAGVLVGSPAQKICGRVRQTAREYNKDPLNTPSGITDSYQNRPITFPSFSMPLGDTTNDETDDLSVAYDIKDEFSNTVGNVDFKWTCSESFFDPVYDIILEPTFVHVKGGTCDVYFRLVDFFEEIDNAYYFELSNSEFNAQSGPEYNHFNRQWTFKQTAVNIGFMGASVPAFLWYGENESSEFTGDEQGIDFILGNYDFSLTITSFWENPVI